jgi:hypothetical protein
LDPDHFQFNWVRIQANSTIKALTDPVTEPGMDLLVHFSMFIEGGGTFAATNISVQAINITIDDGSSGISLYTNPIKLEMVWVQLFSVATTFH